jgi:hypothetical protein
MTYKNGNDLITFLHNKYLSTDEGRALIKSVFAEDPAIHDAIMKQLDIHGTIMEKLKGGVALDDDHPLIPVSPQSPVSNDPIKKA